MFAFRPRRILYLISETPHKNTNNHKTAIESHYKNIPIQIHRKFHLQRLKIFRWKTLIFFHISAQNIDCGYSLEPPRRGGSNEYPQSMILSRNKKNNVCPCKPQFYCKIVGVKGVKITKTCFRDEIEFHWQSEARTKWNRNWTTMDTMTDNYIHAPTF